MCYVLPFIENWLSFVPDLSTVNYSISLRQVEETFPNRLTVFSILQSTRHQVSLQACIQSKRSDKWIKCISQLDIWPEFPSQAAVPLHPCRLAEARSIALLEDTVR